MTYLVTGLISWTRGAGRLIPLLSLVFVQLGCTTPPPVGQLDSPVPLPSAWHSTADTDTASISSDSFLDEAWWTMFKDDGLNALVAEALENNHDLAIAAHRVDQVLASATIAGADRWPNVGAELSRSRRKQNFIGLPIPGLDGPISSESTTWSTGLSASWELDLWGRVRAGAVAANAEAEAAIVDERGARLSIAAIVAKTWFALGESRQQVLLAESTVTSYRTTSEQVRMRFEEGTRNSLDLRLSLSSLASAEARLEERRYANGVIIRQLEVILGRYPEEGLQGSLDLFEDATSELAPIPVGLPADVLARRPDLMAAERRWVAADSRVWQAKAALLPRISLTAAGGSSSTELGDLANGDFSVWSLLTNLAQPIFQGGRLRANVSRAGATRDILAASFAQTALEAFAEVENALAAESFLSKQERFIQDATEQAQAARLLAEDRYRAGLVNYITVLQAQQQALAAEGELLTARRRRLDARTDLITALGGGWSNDSNGDDS